VLEFETNSRNALAVFRSKKTIVTMFPAEFFVIVIYSKY